MYTHADPTDYTDDFGGTSASAPIVSGVVALMLQANPNLSWRDVKHILAKLAATNRTQAVTRARELHLL